ncbi:MAG: amidohydrolase [Pirellulaceae bacterium]|nr:amidohydrolase [Pirellulaceae bacterium]
MIDNSWAMRTLGTIAWIVVTVPFVCGGKTIGQESHQGAKVVSSSRSDETVPPAGQATLVADLVLYNGKIATVAPQGEQYAEAIAVRGDKIIFVGSDEKIVSYLGEKTKKIDLNGKLAIPGFIEGHAHFVEIGEGMQNVQLMDVKTWDELIDRVKAAAEKAPPGSWIIGRGWHQSKWENLPGDHLDGYPIHDRLSRAVPNHPVWLTHASGHMALGNSKAMELAGVNAQTQDPPGGTILKKANGNPTGVFREKSTALVDRVHSRHLARRTPEEVKAHLLRSIELAGQECLSKGVTTFNDAGVPTSTVDVYRQLAKEGKLPVRLWVMLSEGDEVLARKLSYYKIIGEGNNFLTVRGIKRMLDGALGVHGAWMLHPYEDLPTSIGLNTTSLDSMKKSAELAMKHGFQLCVHAIGDRANREILNIFEQEFKKNPQSKDLRWRVEHAQHLDAADIPRFGQLGVIASMQGIHCTSDAVFVVQRLGLRRSGLGAYVWRDILHSGGVVNNGTDSPVEDIRPIASYYATVSRKLKDGTRFFPEQALSREEALRTYTYNGAYAGHEEKLKGSLEVGKLADIVVLSQDILTIEEDKIPETRVLYTIVGGKVYEVGSDRKVTAWN